MRTRASFRGRFAARFVLCKRISFVSLQIGQDLAGASLEIMSSSGSGGASWQAGRGRSRTRRIRTPGRPPSIHGPCGAVHSTPAVASAAREPAGGRRREGVRWAVRGAVSVAPGPGPPLVPAL
ncbi:hypothetical protein PAHAL_8G068300 [Panicum hallii]|uniref:Uncharacterized protein n=1 Tax=Panicum hallii TaxID=206008 RepID=A0A2T8I807_9POAL|nr:hypothetical protein PAHAL_8G068300 [Panicum hallii]